VDKKYVYWILVSHIDGQEVARGRWGEAEARRALQSESRNKIPMTVVNNRWNEFLAPLACRQIVLAT
jgi:hypothetical protein